MSKGILVHAFNNEDINYVKQASMVAERAKKLLKTGTANWLRAEDIINLAHINLKERKVRK